MYTLLIVDDELIICESLKSKISRLGFSEIGEIITCTSGEEAISISKKIKPQIVITDIKMPGMNGIQLIQELSTFLDPAYFFVLSGYDDYTYVRDAFRQGAIDYLLKPVRLKDLKNSMETAISSLKSTMDLSNQQKGDSYDISLMINALINPENLATHIRRQTEDLLTESLPFSDFYVGLITFNEDINKLDKDEIKDTVCGFIDNLKGSSSDFHIFYSLTPANSILLLINVAPSLDHTTITRAMESLLAYLHDSLGLANVGGLSSRHNSIQQLSQMYRQTNFALATRLLHGYSKLYNYSSEPDNSSMVIDSQIQFQLEVLLDNPNLVLISRFFQEYLTVEYLLSLSVHELKYLYEHIISRIQTSIDSSFNSELLKDPRDFFTFNSLDQFRSYIRDCFYEFHKLFMESYSGEKTIIDLARQYIEENYNKKITLADLSSMFSVSYTHFSTLFKKTTGSTFSEYLQKVRMEKACELLKNPQNRIQDIAIEVGYDNAYHFSRAFKNYLGVSPKHFREGGTGNM